MGKVLNFNSLEEFNEFLVDKTCRFVVGEGSEGKCILSKDRKFLYKKLEDDFVSSQYDVGKIITTDDFDFVHYILPSELYVLKDKLLGYKTKYISGNDLFKIFAMECFEDVRKMVDFDSLLSSYYEMLDETNKFSKEKVRLYDLLYNLMFIKNNLYGIDTCLYERVDYNVFDSNKELLDLSIKEVFDVIFNYYSETVLGEKKIVTLFSEKERIELYNETDMDKYVKKLRHIVNR